MNSMLLSTESSPPAQRTEGPGTLWNRLLDGVWQFSARGDWTRFNGPDWLQEIMQTKVTNDFHAKQGRSTGRKVLEAGQDRLVVYLKRHNRLPWWCGWGATIWPGGEWSPAMQERRNLLWADRNGLPVPKVVAAGECLGPWGKLESFLAVEELTGMLPLHQAVPLAAGQLEPATFRHWKAGLVREMARLARCLHDRNAFHKDLYFCHFFVARADTYRVPVWTDRVSMIDFHRLAFHPITRLFWISKDLGQLLYSSEVEGIDARDRLRFWHAYMGRERRSWVGRWLRRVVRIRGRNYRKHNAKKARQSI